MKKTFLILMVLVFNLSNAQYLEVGTNLKSTLIDGVTTFQLGAGYESKGIDVNLYYQGYVDVKVNTIALALSKVWYAPNEASGISLGAIFGSDIYKGGNDLFYSPDFSCRMHVTDKFKIVFQAFIPQYNINKGITEWNDEIQLNIKFRLKV